MNYKEIITSINNKDLNPVYFLIGEEPYYIDKLLQAFSNNILTPEEQEFNQITLYGKDIEIDQIISEAKQFPFGANKRVVIVKEAQHLRNIELLDHYLEIPQKETILVISYKGKSIDKRKKFGKNLKNKCVVFESKKLYDNQVPSWIMKYITDKGHKIDNNATAILHEYLGSDLSKIVNELDKLMLIIKDKEITASIIEEHIGISKDYNVFELQNALGNRKLLKANQIINYLTENTKSYNIVAIISSLFSFFKKIMIYHSLEKKNKTTISSALQINPFFLNQYENTARNYSTKQLFYIFGYLKEYDLRSKGVKNKNTSQKELLKELIFKILHT